MKQRGSQFEYQEERDADLMKVYNEILEKEKFPFHLMDVMKKVVHHSSKAFWVSTQRAFNVISRMRRGEDPELKCENKRLMFEEIYRRVRELEDKHPEERLFLLVEQVVFTEAPSFYMTPASAKVIIHKIKKKWRKEKSLLRQLRH